MRSIGEVVRSMQARYAESAHRYEERKREFHAQGGVCWDCRDTGMVPGLRVERNDPRSACASCEMGRQHLNAIRIDLFGRRVSTSSITPLALPFDSMRCDDVESTRARILAWCDAWHEGWQQPTPHQDNHPFLLLHGLTGSGKTSAAAQAILRVALRQLLVPSYVNAVEAIDALRDRAGGRSDGSFTGQEAIQRYDPLLVDDIGIASYTEFTEGFHYGVVHWRYQRKCPTIFTTNAPIEPESKSPKALIRRIGERSYWRIVELAEVIPITGYNWRDPRNRRD